MTSPAPENALSAEKLMADLPKFDDVNLPKINDLSLDRLLDLFYTAAPGLIAGAAVYLMFPVFRIMVLNRLQKKSEEQALALKGWRYWLLPLIEQVGWWLILALAVFVAVRAAGVPDSILFYSSKALTIAFFCQIGLWASTLLNLKANRMMAHGGGWRDASRATMMATIATIGHVGIWILLALLALENLGVDISALMAGLGIGGIAIAFAFKSVLEDVFASLSIAFDRPFVIGDFIISGDHMGTVEKIGLKNVRIRSLSGEQIIINNNDILSERIRNFGRMQERRVLFTVGVEYGTPLEKLRAIPDIIRAAVESRENTRFDRSHFRDYGDFSLNFETVYFMTVPDYNTMMDTQQAVNLSLYETFEKEGIAFAFPTRTVHVVGGDAPKQAAGG